MRSRLQHQAQPVVEFAPGRAVASRGRPEAAVARGPVIMRLVHGAALRMSPPHRVAPPVRRRASAIAPVRT